MKRRFLCAIVFVLFLQLTACGNRHGESVIPEGSTASATVGVEEKAAAEFGKIAKDIECGIYTPEVQKDRLDELWEKYPDDPAVKTYHNVESVVFWKGKIDEMLPGDENYDLFRQYYAEALAAIDLTLDIEYMDSITSYIENFVGMEEYSRVREELAGMVENVDKLSKEEKVAILVTVFEKEEAYGDAITDAITEQIWKEVCEEYQITMTDLIDMMMDMELTGQAFAEIAS